MSDSPPPPPPPSASPSGTPFISLFAPQEPLALVREAGFREARQVPAGDHALRWFAGRTDGLRPSSGEDLLVATA